MPIEGEYGSWDGPLKPSSEWRFHLDIMRARPEVGAVVHTHSHLRHRRSRSARKEIPACHYMIAASGGPTSAARGYATYGTKELSDARPEGAGGPHLLPARQSRHDRHRRQRGKAMWLAVELETLAKQYYLSLAIGGRGPAGRRDRRVSRSSRATACKPSAEKRRKSKPAAKRPPAKSASKSQSPTVPCGRPDIQGDPRIVTSVTELVQARA